MSLIFCDQNFIKKVMMKTTKPTKFMKSYTKHYKKNTRKFYTKLYFMKAQETCYQWYKNAHTCFNIWKMRTQNIWLV